MYIYNSYVFVVGTIANIKWADSDALHSLLTFALATVGIFSAIFYFTQTASLLNNVKRNSDYTTFSVWKTPYSENTLY